MPRKKYADETTYENKLDRVMKRLQVERYNWDCNRQSAFVEFFYKGQFYRFDHDVSKTNGKLHFGSDCFAQIVLCLEDLARAVERGIYDLSVWVAGMKALPEAVQIPQCFVALNFNEIPENVDQVKSRYRQLSKALHPDVGGDPLAFKTLNKAYEHALEHYE